jgi:hypothetical protein
MRSNLPILSHSEVSSMNTCSRAHYYAYGLGLKPKKRSEALSKGIAGHEILAEAMRVYAKQKTYASFCVAIELGIMDLMGKDPLIASQVGTYLSEFMKNGSVRELVSNATPSFIEEKMFLDIPEFGFTYAFTVDAAMVVGNKLEIWDWKFTQNFYDMDIVTLMPQLPRYVGAARQLGWNVTGARFVNIRTRPVKEETEKIKITNVPVTSALIRTAFKDLLPAAERIIALREGGIEKWESKTARAANSINCTNCAFKQPCRESALGADVTLTLQHMYERNDYGYEREPSGSA